MSLTQLGMVACVVPIILSQDVQRCDHLLPGTPGFINPRQNLVRPFIIGVQLQHLFSRCDGVAVLPLTGINLSQVAESVYMFGILLQGFFKRALSPVVVPFLSLLNTLLVHFVGASGYQVIC